MLKKTLIIAAATLVAPTVASLVIGGWIGVQEMKHKLEMKKLEAAPKN